MDAQDFKRKLTAVFSADVAGYSRLMGEDEASTVKTLEAYKQVMFALIKQHRGRVIDSPGDNLLAEFGSVVDAVQCGVAVQNELKARNAALPENRRMRFRIGINLGDVIEEGDRIYGDGVNIAARLEALADPGGICVSKTAFDQIETKLPLGYEYLGDQTVKNIARPVGAYRILMEPRVTVASKDKMAYPLPEVPSIAVLPFVNMSEDPKQDFLCDGMAEEIITSLSKIANLLVISRQSTFSYKGKSVKVKQVSEELGVRYVLEGSLQKSGNRVRITAQLIDALTDDHLWAERYERELKDIFALQDEITMKVLTATQVKLTAGEQVLGIAKYFKGKQGLDCYLKYLEAAKYRDRHNIEDNRMARRIAEEALTMCPENPMVYYLMAQVYQMEYWVGSGKCPEESIEKGIELAQKILEMDAIAYAHALLGHFYMLKGEYEKAIAEGERALALDPGGARAYDLYAQTLYRAGRFKEAIEMFQKATRLNPLGSPSIFSNLGHCYRETGRFEEAVLAYKKALQLAPNNSFAHIALAAAYTVMDRNKEARAEAAEALKINPKFSLDLFAKTLSNKDQSVTDKLVNALRKAGLK